MCSQRWLINPDTAPSTTNKHPASKPDHTAHAARTSSRNIATRARASIRTSRIWEYTRRSTPRAILRDSERRNREDRCSRPDADSPEAPQTTRSPPLESPQRSESHSPFHVSPMKPPTSIGFHVSLHSSILDIPSSTLVLNKSEVKQWGMAMAVLHPAQRTGDARRAIFVCRLYQGRASPAGHHGAGDDSRAPVVVPVLMEKDECVMKNKWYGMRVITFFFVSLHPNSLFQYENKGDRKRP